MSQFLIGIVQQRIPYYLLLTKSWALCFQVISEPFKYFQALSYILKYFQVGLLSKFKPLNVSLGESIMTPKFQCGATCTKGPDREMLTCESTTLRCNPQLEDKPDYRKAGV